MCHIVERLGKCEVYDGVIRALPQILTDGTCRARSLGSLDPGLREGGDGLFQDCCSAVGIEERARQEWTPVWAERWKNGPALWAAKLRELRDLLLLKDDTPYPEG